MTKHQLLGAIAGILTLTTGATQAGPPVRVGIGLNFGTPGPYYYRPYYYAPYYRPYGYYYYPPPPVVYAPPPVVVAPPPPVVYAQPPAPAAAAPIEVQQPNPTYSSPAPPPVVNQQPGATYDQLIANLRSTDENVRRNSVMDLGRTKALQAVQPLSATLAGDQSPAVREAAARALGLIGSPQGLPTLQYAAQADSDRDVRHSSQYAIEVIKSNSR